MVWGERKERGQIMLVRVLLPASLTHVNNTFYIVYTAVRKKGIGSTIYIYIYWYTPTHRDLN